MAQLEGSTLMDEINGGFALKVKKRSLKEAMEYSVGCVEIHHTTRT
jgi:hypothetical protein